MESGWVRRVLLVAAGVLGAVGVMAAAGASHGGESRNLSAIATICLAHGPAVLALGLAAKGRLLVGAGLVLAIGTLVFAGDLGIREWLGHSLFPGAAPLAGGAMILGWASVAVAAAFELPKR
jgi:uncharacterized membrane protein YgdD (TMEM256/DUF423 family)